MPVQASPRVPSLHASHGGYSRILQIQPHGLGINQWPNESAHHDLDLQAVSVASLAMLPLCYPFVGAGRVISTSQGFHSLVGKCCQGDEKAAFMRRVKARIPERHI